jgi:hypothetical protein
MRTALENDRDYELPEHHDPVRLLFDCTFHLGQWRCPSFYCTGVWRARYSDMCT